MAVRQILVHLLDTLRGNVDGVIEDLDPEPLHDLRVATRRTRSALSTIKSVLPDSFDADFAPGFKWLGNVTGPCRDLDVHLIEMEGFQRQLELSDGSLDPLRQLLEELRRDEHLRVCESLDSERFRNLIEEWDEALHSETETEPEPSHARRPVIDLAGRKIHKAYRRFVRRGAKLADDAPEKAFHRLRIDAKKLRYLLEFFSDLYPEIWSEAARAHLISQTYMAEDGSIRWHFPVEGPHWARFLEVDREWTPAEFEGLDLSVLSIQAEQGGFMTNNLLRAGAPSEVADTAQTWADDLDNVLKRLGREALAEAVPRAVMVEYSDTHHWLHLQSPDRVILTILEFLETQGGAGP